MKWLSSLNNQFLIAYDSQPLTSLGAAAHYWAALFFFAIINAYMIQVPFLPPAGSVSPKTVRTLPQPPLQK